MPALVDDISSALLEWCSHIRTVAMSRAVEALAKPGEKVTENEANGSGYHESGCEIAAAPLARRLDQCTLLGRIDYGEGITAEASFDAALRLPLVPTDSTT